MGWWAIIFLAAIAGVDVSMYEAAIVDGASRMQRIVAAQSPLLGTAMMGLPGLSVPTGLNSGLPVGVQLVANRYREDRLLRAGALIEERAGFNAVEHLPF